MEKTGDETIIVSESKFGKGIFAVKDLYPGTVLLQICGKEMTFEETIALGHKESHSMQIGIHEYVLVEPPFLFSNHSCDPNCGLNSKLEMVTIKPVAKNEELTWDYSTSMLERHWTLKCHCGTAVCREIVRDFDLLPFHIQQKYLQKNIVLPFIIEMLNIKKIHFQVIC